MLIKIYKLEGGGRGLTNEKKRIKQIQGGDILNKYQ